MRNEIKNIIRAFIFVFGGLIALILVLKIMFNYL